MAEMLSPAERERVITALRAIYTSTTIPHNRDICQQLGISESALCRYKKQMGLSHIASTEPAFRHRTARAKAHIAKLQARHKQVLEGVKQAYEDGHPLAETVAEQLGTTVGVIYKLRAELGISGMMTDEEFQQKYSHHCQHGEPKELCRKCYLDRCASERASQRARENQGACIGL
jgi:hypothetical protein